MLGVLRLLSESLLFAASSCMMLPLLHHHTVLLSVHPSSTRVSVIACRSGYGTLEGMRGGWLVGQKRAEDERVFYVNWGLETN
jgi:hypothetical protein